MDSLSPRILAALTALRHDCQLIRRGKIYQSDQQIAPFNELASMSLQTARGYGWLEWLPNELKYSL